MHIKYATGICIPHTNCEWKEKVEALEGKWFCRVTLLGDDKSDNPVTTTWREFDVDGAHIRVKRDEKKHLCDSVIFSVIAVIAEALGVNRYVARKGRQAPTRYKQNYSIFALIDKGSERAPEPSVSFANLSKSAAAKASYDGGFSAEKQQ